MKRTAYRGGQNARRGHYWDFRNGDRVHLKEQGILPGGEDRRWYRLHPVFILIAAPFLGLAYAIFLPAAGIVMAVAAILGRLFRGLTQGILSHASFTWQPSAAYLAARREKKARKEKKTEKTD